PGARVFLVRIFGKAGIGKEVAGSPLPYIADHLTAAVGRVAIRMTSHIAAAIRSQVEIGRGDKRNYRGSSLPIELGRQTSDDTSAIIFGYEPRNVRDRTIRLERNPSIEMTAHPSTIRISDPIDRMICLCPLTPCP